MSILIVARAVLVRVLFACHGIMAIWRLYMVTGKVWSWYLCGALLLLFLETLFTIAKKKGNEWKWFCPSVFFYLLSVVPAIWFLELHEIDTRIAEKVEQIKSNVTNASIILDVDEVDANITKETLSLNVAEFGLNIEIPIAFPADLWLRILEQFLLLMLIIGRWILPKGSISHDQLSQLLLVYVGTAADIVEFYEAFSEEEVKYNRMLCFIILGIWTLSLLQFTLVLTATKARRDQVGLPMQVSEFDDDGACCNPELYGILTSIVLQDLPFLIVRLLLIFKYRVVSYTNMFFTSKNSLVITLLLYRLIVVQIEARKKRQQNQQKRDSVFFQLQNVNDINANGNNKNGSSNALRSGNKSKSAPNVSQLDTLKRAKPREGSPISTVSVPHNNSESSLQSENVNGRKTGPRKVKKRKS